MNRVLALQGLTGTSMGSVVFGDSNQSVGCSSSTARCSTTSAGCGPTVPLMAW